MTELARRLNEAFERQMLTSVLEEIKQEIKKSPDQSRILFNCVLQNSRKLIRLLTSSEVDTFFSQLFSTGCVVEAILALSSQLNSEEVSTSLISTLVFLIGQNLEKIFKDSMKIPATDDVSLLPYSDVSLILVNLKDKIANATSKLKLSSDQYKEWKLLIEETIVNALMSTLEFAKEEVTQSRDINLKIVSLFLSKGRNMNIKNISLLSLIVEWLSTSMGSDPIGRRITERLMTDESHGAREFESFLSTVILSAKNNIELQHCLGYSIKRSQAVRRVCCVRLLLQRICPDRIPRMLASYILSCGDQFIFLDTLKNLLSSWSDVSTVRSLPVEQQNYLTRSILEFSKLLSGVEISDLMSSSIMAFIIKGVQARLSSPDLCIRQSGMFVGEFCCSFFKNTEEPLKFDYEEDDWIIELRRIVSKQDDSLLEHPVTSYNISIENELEANVPSVSLLDSDDEEEFPAFHIPETEKNFAKLNVGEEPEKKASAPRYIRNCIEQLDEKEHYEVFEAAFNTLDSLIRSKAVGFNDVAIDLMGKLIFMSDSYNTIDFEETRRKCLVSCLVSKPELAPRICELMYSRTCALYHRYLILEVIVAASKELSKTIPTTNPSGDKKAVEEVVDKRIQSKTRYFGSKKDSPTAKPSRFASVATLFFYPLISGTTEDHLQLKSKDASFLSRIIYSAGEVLQLASNSPSIVKMSITLDNLTNPLRYHGESFIRGAVMFSYHSIVTSLSSNVLAEVFGSRIESWIKWTMSQVEDTNLSEQDRKLAALTTNAIVDKYKQYTEQLT